MSYESNLIDDEDVFMKEFKFFKKIKDLTELKEKSLFIDIQSLNENSQEVNILEPVNTLNSEEILNKYGLKNINDWKIFEVKQLPGLLVIPNPFKNGYQRFFIKKFLLECPNLPNKTNLDLHIHRKLEDNLWLNAVRDGNFTEFNKLRWTTIGYHYDWTYKVYNKSDKTEIPEFINELSGLVGHMIGYNDYKPEAGIINYYHLNSTLSAHQDHSEDNHKAPLISISFGNPGLFLIGKETRSIKPQAILIRSGDIVIMSEKTRLAYHAVPKIFKDDINNYFNYDDIEEQQHINYINEKDWILFKEYIQVNRINLNIRQVY